MPGPKPNPERPHSRHRPSARSRGLILLPVNGCELPAPKLPAGRTWSRDERRAWRELWAAPQASQWDDSAVAVVAMFVVHSGAVLSGSATAWQAREARHLADALGLTPAGMAALGWKIEAPAAGQPAAALSLVRGDR